MTDSELLEHIKKSLEIMKSFIKEGRLGSYFRTYNDLSELIHNYMYQFQE